MEKKIAKPRKHFSPYLLIILSFLTIIIIGTLLLWLPFSSVNNKAMTFFEALFLATSATTVTGLVPHSLIIPSLSIFGKIVVLILMQIGGLSVITFSVFILSLFGAKIGINERVLLRENLNQQTLSGIVKLLRRIVRYTLVIELIGFILNLIVFSRAFSFGEAMLISALFTVSSFNNAGFDLFFDPAVITLAASPLLTLTTMVLIMLGGLGMIVIFEVIDKHRWRSFTVHTKIVLIMNLVLWIFGAFALKLGQNDGNSLNWVEAITLSISARTAGTNVYNVSLLSGFSTLILIILMFVGGSPTGTAGGIKTTTFFTLMQSTFSYAKGKDSHVGKRQISKGAKGKAHLLLFVFLLLVNLGTLTLLLFDDISLTDALFITTSAATNTGFSTLPLETLNLGSHLSLVFVMFIGRVGPLTFLSVFNQNWHQKDAQHIKLLEENIVIG